MNYIKNQKIELKIFDMTKDGLGIAKIDSQVFFVKDALIGDTVSAIITKVSSNVIYAKVVEILNKSNYRIKSNCSVASSCGGCQLLNLDYKKQLELKTNYVINTINKIGRFDRDYIDKHYDGIISMSVPYRFRNKMQVPFAMKNGDVMYGFFASRTHHIVESDNCIVGFEGTYEVLNAIKKAITNFGIKVYDERTNTGVFREALIRCGNTSKEISLTYILNDNNIDKSLELYKDFDNYVCENIHLESFRIVTSTININTSTNNVLLGKENIVIRGKGYIEDKIGDIKYHISPESFYQVNIEMTKSLYDKVVEYADFKGDESVLDLYCGIGTISLYIAKHVKDVTGIEIVKKAIENAKENAAINNIDNARFICADAEKDLSNNSLSLGNEIDKYNVVIVDPPRRGLNEDIIKLISNIQPKKIIYVSCDPATLARDLNIFCHESNDYELKKIINVDMFPHTMHVETVALIENRRMN